MSVSYGAKTWLLGMYAADMQSAECQRSARHVRLQLHRFLLEAPSLDSEMNGQTRCGAPPPHRCTECGHILLREIEGTAARHRYYVSDAHAKKVCAATYVDLMRSKCTAAEKQRLVLTVSYGMSASSLWAVKMK